METRGLAGALDADGGTTRVHGDGGNLGLVNQLLVAVGVGQQHAVLVETADGPLQFDAAHQEDGDLTAVLRSQLRAESCPFPREKACSMVE